MSSSYPKRFLPVHFFSSSWLNLLAHGHVWSSHREGEMQCSVWFILEFPLLKGGVPCYYYWQVFISRLLASSPLTVCLGMFSWLNFGPIAFSSWCYRCVSPCLLSSSGDQTQGSVWAKQALCQLGCPQPLSLTWPEMWPWITNKQEGCPGCLWKEARDWEFCLCLLLFILKDWARPIGDLKRTLFYSSPYLVVTWVFWIFILGCNV